MFNVCQICWQKKIGIASRDLGSFFARFLKAIAFGGPLVHRIGERIDEGRTKSLEYKPEESPLPLREFVQGPRVIMKEAERQYDKSVGSVTAPKDVPIRFCFCCAMRAACDGYRSARIFFIFHAILFPDAVRKKSV